MKLNRNLATGLFNSLWSACVGFASIPYYIKYLGIEAYGMIGFFLAAQSILQILDLGISPTISREVSRQSALGQISNSGVILHTLACVYWGMAALIGLLFLALTPTITEHWLQGNKLSHETIKNSVYLLGLVIACRWPIGLYTGALLGAERIDISSGINVSMVTATNAGAILILAFISPTIEAFFAWQAAAGITYAIAIRKAAWIIIGKSSTLKFNLYYLKNIARFTAGMSAIGFTALILTQMDKVILSKVLGLEEFGKYMLASVAVSVIYVLVTPVFNIIYPRFSSLAATSNNSKIEHLYRLGTRILSSILLPLAMILVVFGEDLLTLWTGNKDIANTTAPIISLLAIGSALHGIMHFPYALQLAHGNTRLPLAINLFLILILAPLIYHLVIRFGPLGGAAAWMILHITYLLLGTWMTHRLILNGTGLRWLLLDVGVPLSTSISVGTGTLYALTLFDPSPAWRLTLCAIIFPFSVVASLATSKQVRLLVAHALSKRSLSI